MPFLIDGYNLLNVAGVEAGPGPGTALERARDALLRQLASLLSADERPFTTIVFDARDAPAGLPRQLEFRGMAIRFAERHEEADDVIEDLIRLDHAPRQLVVVSSDHRVQRAALRRRATAIDSHRWLGWLHSREHPRTANAARPPLPNAAQVDHWMRQFSLDPTQFDPTQIEPPPFAQTTNPPSPTNSAAEGAGSADSSGVEETPTEDSSSKRSRRRKRGEPRPRAEGEKDSGSLANPFPPDFLLDFDFGDWDF